MTGIINRVPIGLLDILDMKSRGQNPRELAPQLQATLGDTLDLYCRPRSELVTNTTLMSSATSFSFTTTVVPQTEMWYVTHVEIKTAGVLTGAGAIMFRGGYRDAVLQQRIFFPLTNSVVWSAGNNPAWSWPDPFWLYPGDQMCVDVPYYQAFAPDPTAVLFMRITRIGI